MAAVQVAGPSFALQSAQESRVLIDEAAARLNVAGLIVEKDFWVGWLLGRLFAMPALAGQLQFKGGTSLSMVFGAVRRFSEDINLAILPAALGFEEGYFNDAPSASQRRKRIGCAGAGQHRVRAAFAATAGGRDCRCIGLWPWWRTLAQL